MLLNLFSAITGSTAQPEPTAKEKLRILTTNVKDELARTEAMFNMAEDDTLIDTLIYQQNSLFAYQQYLFQLLRENEPDEPESFMLDAVQAQSMGVQGIGLK